MKKTGIAGSLALSAAVWTSGCVTPPVAPAPPRPMPPPSDATSSAANLIDALLGRCLDAVAERREVQDEALGEHFVTGVAADGGTLLVDRASSRATLEINLAPFHPCRFTSRDGALRNRQLGAQVRASLAARGAEPEGGPNA